MIVGLLGEHQIYGDEKLIKFNNIRAVDKANSNSIVFISKETINKKELILSTNSKIIIIDSIIGFDKGLILDKIFIIVENPKIIFSKIGNKYFTKKINYTIHSSAIIHNEAKISKNVLIGPNCVIGKGIIEEGAIIYGNVFIYDNFHIGKNVIINAGTIVGSEGFGYNKDENDNIVQFPHLGGVIIEDNVEIGANTCIDRGSLSNTMIKKNVKIDNNVQVAHNAFIDENTLIMSNVVISGSCNIGSFCSISTSVTISDKISIGDNTKVGLGSVVSKNLKSNSFYLGYPIKKLN